MKVKTISIDGFDIQKINSIMEKNLMNGWVFLGYGNVKYDTKPKSICVRPLLIDHPIMSFRHDDWTEETEFYEL